jgi:hypothetical protein
MTPFRARPVRRGRRRDGAQRCSDGGHRLVGKIEQAASLNGIDLTDDMFARGSTQISRWSSRGYPATIGGFLGDGKRLRRKCTLLREAIWCAGVCGEVVASAGKVKKM